MLTGEVFNWWLDYMYHPVELMCWVDLLYREDRWVAILCYADLPKVCPVGTARVPAAGRLLRDVGCRKDAGVETAVCVGKRDER